MKKNKNNSFLSFSFSKGFTSPNLPIVTFTQGDKELNFILDTGSDDNVISRETLESIEYEEIEHAGTLAGVNGIQNVAACILTFQYENETFKTVFLVSDHLKEAFDEIRRCYAIPLHGMIGSKFLRTNNIIIDFNKMEAYNKEG